MGRVLATDIPRNSKCTDVLDESLGWASVERLRWVREVVSLVVRFWDWAWL